MSESRHRREAVQAQAREGAAAAAGGPHHNNKSVDDAGDGTHESYKDLVQRLDALEPESRGAGRAWCSAEGLVCPFSTAGMSVLERELWRRAAEEGCGGMGLRES